MCIPKSTKLEHQMIGLLSRIATDHLWLLYAITTLPNNLFKIIEVKYVVQGVGFEPTNSKEDRFTVCCV